MKPRHVLVIEDDEGMQEALDLLLRGAGYEVTVAASGEEGLARLQEGLLPDLVLLDLVLPGMDGWEVLKLLHLDRKSRDLPVIVLTVRSEPRDRIRGLQEGAVDYLSKPFDNRDLLARIEAVVEADRAVRGEKGVPT